jgi:antitoxin MazE
MQVSKWGDNLAIVLPDSVVEAHHLKEGDEIDISIVSTHAQQAARRKTVEAALADLHAMSRPFPADFRFDRDEANER